MSALHFDGLGHASPTSRFRDCHGQPDFTANDEVPTKHVASVHVGTPQGKSP